MNKKGNMIDYHVERNYLLRLTFNLVFTILWLCFALLFFPLQTVLAVSSSTVLSRPLGVAFPDYPHTPRVHMQSSSFAG